MKCPKCGSQDLRRSPTRWFEKPRRMLLGLGMVRCRACNWRGWREYEEGVVTKERTRASYGGSGTETMLGALLILALIALVIVLFMTLVRPSASDLIPPTNKSTVSLLRDNPTPAVHQRPATQRLFRS